MDLKQQILKDHSKENTRRIVEWIEDKDTRIESIINLFLSDEYRITQRASWVVSTLAEKNPLIIEKYLPKIIPQLTNPRAHIAVRRNTIRLLQFVEIPENLKGFVLDACFSFLENPKEGNVVQVFAMSVIEKFTADFPEIIPEFKLIIERHLENGASPAFNSRAKKTLKRLAFQ